MNEDPRYCCIEAACDRVPLLQGDDGLRCPNGHFFPYAEGTKVPLFAFEELDASEYSIRDAAVIHDNALRWVFETFGTDEASLRRGLVSRLHLFEGATVLVTGAGAGNDLPFISKALGGVGVVYAQDISRQMLMMAVERHGGKKVANGIEIYFSVSDATNLPFRENSFDAAYHFGGLNLFRDIRKGIFEMDRLVKPGGRVVISDEGIAPWLKSTEFGKMLIKNNPLYVHDAPLSLLPETATSVSLSWELSNCFYVIEYTVSDALPHVSIDIPHKGRRGGSIRTRYFGQLEGVDPELRDRVYEEAEKRGISRVAYLESLLKNGLK